ncbi:MAG: recombinase family protein [Gammaproteobacteria bacterium]|nr:recombinase family protein [Gammaproteobacteria bacterium]
MLIGYARVSTLEQNLDSQLDVLKEVGCEKIYADKMNGAKADRPELLAAINDLRAGDALVVKKLDRLGRSIKSLIALVTKLDEKKVGFKSLTENIDTTTSGGKLIFHIFGALAEFERDIIRDRTNAGLKAARARGRLGGRPRKITNKMVEQMKTLYDAKKTPVIEICKSFGISRSAFYTVILKHKR